MLSVSQSPRYSTIVAFIALAHLVVVVVLQYTPPPPTNAVTPLSQHHHTYTCCCYIAVWSQRHLYLYLLPLLLLCPARPDRPHPIHTQAPSQSSSSAPVLPPARSPGPGPSQCSSRPLQQQQAPASPHTSPDQAPAPAKLASRRPSYTPIVLGCLLACCLRACLCVVRRYASLQALACCLLCAVVTTAPPTPARPLLCLCAMPPRAPLQTSFSVADVNNEVVCPLRNQDGSHCRKRCLGVSLVVSLYHFVIPLLSLLCSHSLLHAALLAIVQCCFCLL